MKIIDEAVQAAIEGYNKTSRIKLQEKELMRNALSAALPHLQTGYKVKQLEWELLSGDHYARGCDAQYNIYETDPNHWNSVVISPKNVRLATKVSLDEAKAAAQADFERRVHDCIDDTLTSEGTNPVDVAAVLEALRSVNIHEEANSYEWRGDGDYTPNGQEKALLEDFGNSLVSGIGEAIRALSAAPTEGRQWSSDMDLAPSDTVVLMAWFNSLQGGWEYEAGVHHSTRGGWRHGSATHWMPFPAAPTKEDA